MERRETIRECEEYKATNIGGKCKWDSSMERTPGVGNELRKKRRDYKEKSAT